MKLTKKRKKKDFCGNLLTVFDSKIIGSVDILRYRSIKVRGTETELRF